MSLDQLFDIIDKDKLAINKTLVKKAYNMMVKAHGQQTRASGEPYFLHPFEAAKILLEYKLDTASIVTALLHDTVEDTQLTLKDIEREFSPKIASLVDGVTKLNKIEFQPDHIRQAENFRKLLLAMSEDIRVLIVKLADRLHNMRTLEFFDSNEKQIRIAHETMEIYAPLAERIGMQRIKNELQDLAFWYLHPNTYNSIAKRLEYLRNEGHLLVEKIEDEIKKLMQENNIKALVTGREKTPFSIWVKMENKNIGFEQLSDVMAFRIIVDSVEDCYKVLGEIHTHYHVVPGYFKDFISIPKMNHYQSIHTVVMGPEKQRIEVQIRTQYMHEIAEKGVAAHWTYKQDYKDKSHASSYKWIREMLTILEHSSGFEDMMENTKLEMEYNQVFCFTPKGSLVTLPVNATPVDFAFALHSDIGFSCSGAKVNGRVVPLDTVLQHGDQVEIIRSKHQKPSATWEKFVVTGKARSEVRKFIRDEQRQEYLKLGNAILQKALAEQGVELNDKILNDILPIFHTKTEEDLFIAVGEGLISRGEVVQVVLSKNKVNSRLKDKLVSLRLFKVNKTKQDGEFAIPIKGMEAGMALHFATCCHPIFGDRIVGIMNRGKGITVHVFDCTILSEFSNSPEKFIELAWDKKSINNIFNGQVKVTMFHTMGSLASVASSISDENGNITNLRIINRSNDFFEALVDIEVTGTKHINNIIAALRVQPLVYNVERTKV